MRPRSLQRQHKPPAAHGTPGPAAALPLGPDCGRLSFVTPQNRAMLALRGQSPAGLARRLRRAAEREHRHQVARSRRAGARKAARR